MRQRAYFQFGGEIKKILPVIHTWSSSLLNCASSLQVILKVIHSSCTVFFSVGVQKVSWWLNKFAFNNFLKLLHFYKAQSLHKKILHKYGSSRMNGGVLPVVHRGLSNNFVCSALNHHFCKIHSCTNDFGTAASTPYMKIKQLYYCFLSSSHILKPEWIY